MNNIFKKIIVRLLIAAVLFLPLANAVYAVQIENPLSSKTFLELLDKILTFAIQLALAIAPIMLIVAGFYYITAQGEEQKVKTAFDIIKWVLIGLLIVLCSKAIVEFMQTNIFN